MEPVSNARPAGRRPDAPKALVHNAFLYHKLDSNNTDYGTEINDLQECAGNMKRPDDQPLRRDGRRLTRRAIPGLRNISLDALRVRAGNGELRQRGLSPAAASLLRLAAMTNKEVFPWPTPIILKTALGGSDVLAVCGFSRWGCISLGRGGAAAAGAFR